MKKLTLVAKRDDSTGELGLMIEGTHSYAVNSATDGLLIAHDIIEHPRLSGLGRIDDELEALGAIWMCRGRHGQLNKTGIGRAYSIEENIASDVTRMAADVLNGGEETIAAPTRRQREHDHDGAFREIIAIGIRGVPSELNEPLTHAQRLWLADYELAALYYMRRGARTLMRRYPGQYDANNIFWAIADAVQPYARPEFEGARYVLRYGYQRNEWIATCEEDYGDDDY